MQAGQNWHDVAVPRLLRNNSTRTTRNKGCSEPSEGEQDLMQTCLQEANYNSQSREPTISTAIVFAASVVRDERMISIIQESLRSSVALLYLTHSLFITSFIFFIQPARSITSQPKICTTSSFQNARYLSK